MPDLNHTQKMKILRMVHEGMDIKKNEQGSGALSALVLKWNSFLMVTFGPKQSKIAQAQQKDEAGNYKADPLAQSYIDRVHAIDDALEKTGEALSVSKEQAEKQGLELLRLASFDEERFDECYRNVKAYFATKQGAALSARMAKGEKVTYPAEIAAQIDFIEQAKDSANEAANIYMGRSSTFRKNREPFILKTLADEHGANVFSLPNVGLFRFVRLEDMSDPDAYGMPNYIFKHGFTSPLFKKYSFHVGTGFLNMPHICHQKNCDDPARFGWTSGGVSTTANAVHAICHNFVSSKPTEDGILYLIRAPEKKAVSIAPFSNKTGYDGRADASIRRSNAEDAMEFLLAGVRPEEVFSARQCIDGKLGPAVINPRRRGVLEGDIETQKYETLLSTTEAQILSYKDKTAPQLRHLRDYPNYEMEMAQLIQDCSTERLEVLTELAELSIQAAARQKEIYARQKSSKSENDQNDQNEGPSDKTPGQNTGKGFDAIKEITFQGICNSMAGVMNNLYRDHIVETLDLPMKELLEEKKSDKERTKQLIDEAFLSLYTEEDLEKLSKASQDPSFVEAFKQSVKEVSRTYFTTIPPDHKAHYEFTKNTKESYQRGMIEDLIGRMISVTCDLTGTSCVYKRGYIMQNLCNKGGSKFISLATTAGFFMANTKTFSEILHKVKGAKFFVEQEESSNDKELASRKCLKESKSFNDMNNGPKDKMFVSGKRLLSSKSFDHKNDVTKRDNNSASSQESTPTVAPR